MPRFASTCVIDWYDWYVFGKVFLIMETDCSHINYRRHFMFAHVLSDNVTIAKLKFTSDDVPFLEVASAGQNVEKARHC